ncbi:YcfL family protein [Alkanindiges sp. WGS2144]|uniref:YcfL family protein n=1 Tax=Alkanindiges sp. WGS2144 TaxID=3366808 RepID=UPI003752F979
MKTTHFMAALTLIAASLTGCTAPNAMLTTTDSEGNSSVRTITNNAVLSTRIGVNRVNMTNLGDIKRVSLSLKNGWYYAQAFEYKIVWMDASGTEINPEGATWKPVSLQGREAKTVQSVAPNPSAVDIVVYLKKV